MYIMKEIQGFTRQKTKGYDKQQIMNPTQWNYQDIKNDMTDHR